jgi:hypothetical protein
MRTTEKSGVAKAMPLHIHMSRLQLCIAQRIHNLISMPYMPGLAADLLGAFLFELNRQSQGRSMRIGEGEYW